MENKEVKKKFNDALDMTIQKFKSDSKCLAAFLIGSMSHDVVWEHSDLNILLIFDDSYKGPSSYYLMECDVPVVINITKRNNFKNYIESTNVSDYFFCALSKSKILFSKDPTLEDFMEDIFYIGKRDQQIEMLLGFSEAVYYLNKVEKNYTVKKDRDNAIYFLFDLVKGIAWIEVARSRSLPEREIIAQARKLKPDIFNKIYEPLINEKISDELIESIVSFCHEYLKDNTIEIYRPILSYLKVNKTLKDFSLTTRDHGFGINYEWLYRIGLVDIYVEPIKINNSSEEFYSIGYRLKEGVL